MTTNYRMGVGAIIQNEAGLILVGNRVDIKIAWQMPQGGIDDGESAEEALLRELKEEIGTNDVTILNRTKQIHRYLFPEHIKKRLSKMWGTDFLGQEQVWFLCTLNPSATVNVKTEHPEFLSTQWMSAENVITHAVDFKRPMLIDIFKELKLLGD
ncbi:MAG: RNA pyrophosphohydrolase [Holosporales bacterium]